MNFVRSTAKAKPFLRTLTLLGAMVFATESAQSQQILVNGGFEAIQQPTAGNNMANPNTNIPPPDITPWMIGSGSGTVSNANVVRVDGPGTFNYATGPNADASGQPGWRHYLDIAGGSNEVYQSFRPRCAGQVTFSGFFSSRFSNGPLPGTGRIAIHQGNTGSSGGLVAQTPVASLTSTTWQQVSATATVAAGQNYSFVVSLDNNLNFDEGSVTYVENCSTVTDVVDNEAGLNPNVLPHLIVPPDPCCPPWTEQTLQDSLTYFNPGSIASPYTLRWQPPASLNAQMQAYINYLHAVDPAITSVTIAFGVFQAGTGAAPAAGGAQVGGTGGTRLVTWTAGANAPTVPANFFPAAIMQPGSWYTVGTTIFLNDGNSFFPETCAQNAISVRVQVVPGVRPSGGSTTRSAGVPMEVRLAPRSIGPAAPARRSSGRAR